MADDTKLGEILLRENLLSQAHLKTALDFQKKVGGDLGDILVKLGYVKESILAEIEAQSQHVGASAEINAQVIDVEALRALPRSLLEKHQVIPLKGGDPNTIVLAMSDPNNLQAIEEIQFLVNRVIEPAVAPKGAIRKALNQLDDLLKQAAARPALAAPPASQPAADRTRAILALPIERLLRAYIILQVEKGNVSADELLQRAEKLG